MRAKPQLVALLAALCLLSVGMSGCVSTAPATSTTQFTTGTAPPRAVSDLIQNGGTAVLLINQYGCPPCGEEIPKFADLQTQYKDTNVSFATFNIDDNSTSKVVAMTYGVTFTPQIFVIREDGAFAKFIGAPNSTGLIDLSTVKSAIDDAQKWQSLNPTATVAPPTDYSNYYNYNSSYWMNNVIVTPFYRTTSADGNDLYVGVVRNYSQQSVRTLTLELCTSKAQAAVIYQTTVTDATNMGYVARADNGASLYPVAPLGAWQGDYGLSFKSVAYYQDPHVGNVWVVETQYT
jgi:thiol-disulfide isomerase/thioredoxin